jgi:16S rRNA G1207 methylase RsmC
MKNKRMGQPPKNPRLANLLHSLKLGESIRIIGGSQDEIRRMTGSLNRTIKRKGISLSYRKGSYNRHYITALSNHEMKTIRFNDLEVTQKAIPFTNVQEMVEYISRHFPGIRITA